METCVHQSFGLLGRAKDPEDVLRESQDPVGPLSDAPALVRESTSFPYIYGYRFAYHEGKDGLTSPPATTEQILHPGSQGRQNFQAIDLSEYARSMETEGCRDIYQDTMGEFTLSLWLRKFNALIAQQVWEGWDGDRWIAAECNNGREMAWLTSWDTEKDAVEFEEAVRGIAATLQSQTELPSLSTTRDGKEVAIVSEGLRSRIFDVRNLARRARVTSRTELASHFARPQ